MTAAWLCQKQVPGARVVLLEFSSRLGGVLRTTRQDGWLIEHSADMFTTESSDAVQLCRDLGILDELISTSPIGRSAWVAKGTMLYPVPRGLALMLPHRLDSLLTTPIMSRAGNYRAIAERWIPRREDTSDESLSQFATRRFGRETFERLIQPLVGGIYSADPDRLSMRAALARFVEAEQRYGSLTAAAWHQRYRSGAAAQPRDHETPDQDHSRQPVAFTPAESARQIPTATTAGADRDAAGARYGKFVAPRNGMQSLVDHLQHALQRVDVRLDAKVDNVSPDQSREGASFQIHWTEHGERRSSEFDAVIVATPAPTTSSLLRSMDPELAQVTGAINAASMAIVVLGFDMRQLRQLPECFGFVVPEIERCNVMACSVSSQKFAGRAPKGKVLLRCFIGGQMHGDRVAWSDATLRDAALADLTKWIGIDGDPELVRVFRWHRAMPQYELGHLDRVSRVQSLLAAHPRLAVCGNAWSGVGIPACIASARRAVQRVMNSASR